ncbi:hypothetical protein GQ53DRAFT_818457 [Thozetella sp. PMI_491]|nr:hypothetical protein GQ53DRAFT_818457 [Thozetella sp. PMI_491]
MSPNSACTINLWQYRRKAENTDQEDLSTSAKITIGVTVAIVGVGIIAVMAFMMFMRRRKAALEKTKDEQAAAGTDPYEYGDFKPKLKGAPRTQSEVREEYGDSNWAQQQEHGWVPAPAASNQPGVGWDAAVGTSTPANNHEMPTINKTHEIDSYPTAREFP